MKVLIIILLLSGGMQPSYCDGYEDGFLDGYCYGTGIELCLPPLPPLCPSWRAIDEEDSYKGGYQRGFLVGYGLNR